MTNTLPVASLNLRQDFAADFTAITAGLLPGYAGPPYAFARYADGELALMSGRPHQARSDHWCFRGGPSPLAEPLRRSIECTLPGWHVGISCPCHQRQDYLALLKMVNAAGLPHDRLTFATLFVGDGYYRFRELLEGRFTCSFIDHVKVVSHTLASPPELRVPRSGIEPAWLDWSPIVDALTEVRRPIAVAAGPLANIIIHEYWQRMAARDFRDAQVIVDIGSAADRLIRGRRSRRHQNPGFSESSQFCRWPNANNGSNTSEPAGVCE